MAGHNREETYATLLHFRTGLHRSLPSTWLKHSSTKMTGTPAGSSPPKEAAFDQQVEDKISSAGSSPMVIDPIAERRLVRKLDLRIVPFLFLVYTMSFLDRINIGNARIAGMQEDLHLGVENRYNTAVMVRSIRLFRLLVLSSRGLSALTHLRIE